MHWVIVGAGYTGERLAARLVRRHTVTVTRRSPEGLAATLSAIAVLGLRGQVVDLEDRATLADLPTGDVVVICAPPGDDPDGEIRSLVRALRTPPRVIYVSSTGVYAPAHGAWVDEQFPTEPATPAGHARLRAERALVAANLPSLAILRVAGIYGPGRSIADRLRTGTMRIVGDGSSHVCRIHVDDLVEIIVRAGNTPEVTGVINVADDDPTPLGTVADAVAAALGLPLPPRVAADSVPPEVAGMLLADRRIKNDRLAELDLELRYPSWKDGLLGD